MHSNSSFLYTTVFIHCYALAAVDLDDDLDDVREGRPVAWFLSPALLHQSKQRVVAVVRLVLVPGSEGSRLLLPD